MNIELKSLKSAAKYKVIYPVIILIIIDIAIIFGILTIGNNLYLKYLNLQDEKDDVSKLRSRVVLVRNNKEIFNGRVDEYNNILTKLIPDEESYFSVISALETLAARTGVTITSYTINLKETTEEKLTLSLSISGESQAITKLLREYMYSSGRLLTNDETSISITEQGNLSISFNFFHKEFKDAVSPATVITEKDIEFINEVSSKL